ncbi:transglutaminase-like domain-containing protein [uncultured Sphingomonas sp.]|uniref:SirB1 family protein n=1 Tax=uncultured Sphingomonas sp. TaxID=158754 RepID=UPI0025CBCED7|nr:transglutaminase-like domain-containing protein [uncultured Sphingomonas sp.]
MDEDIAYLGLLEDEAIMLDTAALEIAALDHPGVALDQYADLLTRLTEQLVRQGGQAGAASEQADVLADVVGGEFGFTGDRSTYDDPDNADLIRVIDRRRGLPVSLAILYVAAARRLSWSADVLNTPGHVLVRINGPAEFVLIDPFERGRPVDAGDLAALLGRIVGPGTVPTAEHVAAMPSRAVLVRLLMNQATRAEFGGNTNRALTLYRRMTLIAPSFSHPWWEKARLELQRDDPAAARASLSAMLEVTRDPGMRGHIFGALDAISSASS